MNIVHTIQSLDPAMGGPPVVVTRLAAAQASLGHRVTVYAYQSPGREEQIEKSLDGLPGRESVDFRFIPLGGKGELVFGSRARDELRSVMEDTDFLHTHSVWSTISRVAAQAAREHATPYTVCVHGMLDPWCMSQKRLKKQLALRLSLNKMLDRSAFIHCLNKDEVGFVEAFGYAADLVTIPNGVFLEEFDPRPDFGNFRAARPEIGDDPYVLFLSRLHYKKGLDYLADSFSKVAPKFPDLKLVVAGPDGGARSGFEQQISEAGLSDRVLLTGPIYGQAKLEAVRDATMFCLPSRQEGFSIAITEALALGTPCVVTDACHYPEVAEVNAGFVTELNAQSVADGIESILRSTPEQREEMGEQGRRLVKERFTWPVIAKQSIGVYERYTQSS